MEKNCSICKKTFSANTKGRGKKYCSDKCAKDAINQQKKEWRLRNKSKQLLHQKNAREKIKLNPESLQKQKEYAKQWRLKNKEALEKYLLRNKDKIKKYQKEYSKEYQKNYKYSEKYKEYRASDRYKKLTNKRALKYQNKRRARDPIFKMLVAMRTRLKKYVRLSNISVENPIKELIGCSPDYLRKHLEKQFTEGMSWKNHTINGWHIDHIIPLSSAKTSSELEKLMHYTNLQPLWSKDNIKKSNKY